MVSAVAALMAAVMALMAAPAMAMDFDFDDHDKKDHDCDFKDHDCDFKDRDCDFDDHDCDFDDHVVFFDDFDNFVDFDNENESESGPVDLEFSVTNTGDYANQCVPAQQFGNTGNFNNAPSFVQFDSDADDFEPGGIEVGFGGEVAVDCSSTVQQSSAASS